MRPEISALERVVRIARERIDDNITIKQLHLLLILEMQPGLSLTDLVPELKMHGNLNVATVKTNVATLSNHGVLVVRDAASGNRKELYTTPKFKTILGEMLGVIQ